MTLHPTPASRYFMAWYFHKFNVFYYKIHINMCACVCMQAHACKHLTCVFADACMHACIQNDKTEQNTRQNKESINPEP